jgi:hypothetical protein
VGVDMEIDSSTTCTRCGRTVGLVWYRGHSTLFEGPIRADGQDLVIRRHACDPTRPREIGPVIRRRGGQVKRPPGHGSAP